MRVLIVDDDPLLRVALRQELTNAGFEVATAANGVEALRMAVEQPPDVILLDLAMPVLDGWNAQRLIHSGRATSGIPVILLSAHAGDGEREKFMEAGFAGIIQKPYELSDLLEHIRQAVGGQALIEDHE